MILEQGAEILSNEMRERSQRDESVHDFVAPQQAVTVTLGRSASSSSSSDSDDEVVSVSGPVKPKSQKKRDGGVLDFVLGRSSSRSSSSDSDDEVVSVSGPVKPKSQKKVRFVI